MTIKFPRLRTWRSIIVLSLPVLLGIGPCTGGPGWLERIPGGVLAGEVVAGEVTDFSFVADAGLCKLETRPDFPHSITVNCFNDGEALYVGCMGCADKVWSTYVSSDPRARIKIGEKIYAVTMNRVTDPARMRSPWVNRWQKTRGSEEAPPIPEGYWLYHLTSRQ